MSLHVERWRPPIQPVGVPRPPRTKPRSPWIVASCQKEESQTKYDRSRGYTYFFRSTVFSSTENSGAPPSWFVGAFMRRSTHPGNCSNTRCVPVKIPHPMYWFTPSCRTLKCKSGTEDRGGAECGRSLAQRQFAISFAASHIRPSDSSLRCCIVVIPDAGRKLSNLESSRTLSSNTE